MKKIKRIEYCVAALPSPTFRRCSRYNDEYPSPFTLVDTAISSNDDPFTCPTFATIGTVAINQVNRVVVFYLICLASEWVSDWIDCLGVLNIVN
jgi:hypothetical protein